MDNNLIDKKSRNKIKNQLDRSFFVEAGAGSGKTYCLVERMVNLIKHRKARVENIAAVTFTRKAAAELKERFQIKLEKSSVCSLSSNQRQNIASALLNLDEIFIGTIHSFCSKILRERPVEAGVGPGFEEISEDKNYFYAKNLWSNFIDRQKEKDDKTLNFIQDIGISTNDLEDTYLKLVGYPDVNIVSYKAKKPDFLKANKLITEFIEFFKDKLPEEIPGKGWDKLQEIIIKCRNYIKFGYLKEDRLFVRVLNEMNKNFDIIQNRWQDGRGKEYEEKMLKFQAEVIKPALKSWQEYFYKPLIEFIKKGVDYYRDWRKSHSMLSFEDLLINTANLLRDNKEVRNYFKKKFTHILVDEFQDTDPIQAEIILFLTGQNIEEKNWKNITPAPGSLFVVGDPKQSIYRFRRADIDIYNLVKKIFTQDNCEILSLCSNFRSMPFMQDLSSKVFSGILPEKETKYQAKYSTLNTVRKLEAGYDHGVIENPIEKVYRHKVKEVCKKDADKIASWIKYATSGAIRLQRTDDEIKSGMTTRAQYSDFLILTKNKKNLSLYAESLEKLGIPYDIAGSESFSRTMELAEIYRLFRAIEDDKDPVALITALRGLFFGIRDDELYRFKKAGGKLFYYSNVPESFYVFKKAFKKLREYKKIVDKYKPLVAAEIIIDKLGIIPLAVSEEEGLTRAGNIYKSLELLKDYMPEEVDTFSNLVSSLKELLDNKEIESMSLAALEKNAVRVMNLHKAKGLESPVVILADPLGETKEHEPTYHIIRAEDSKAKGYFTINRPVGSYGSEVIGICPDWDSKASEEKKYNAAERIRLEYVAVTRAKNILVISTYREGKRAKAWQLMYDYLINAPKLKVVEKPFSKEREKVLVSSSELEKEKDKIAKNIISISSATYNLTNVTTEAKEKVIFSEGTAEGISWGRIAHKAVEMVCRDRYEELKILAVKWMEEEDKLIKDVNKLMELADRFMESSLWKRINRAGSKYFEVPFALKGNGNIKYGVIDLVFKEKNGWVIVDYKTDDFEKDKFRKKAYKKQIDLYKKYWESISGEKVKEAILYRL